MNIQLLFKSLTAVGTATCFLTTSLWTSSPAAQTIPYALSTIHAPARPPMLSGMTINPDDPLQFDFIVNAAGAASDDPKEPSGDEGFPQKNEYLKLIKYFLAALTVPDDQMWVNLSPAEPDRIMADGLSKTELGRDMLAQDYLLKQLTASLMSPEGEAGKKFWERVYEKFYEVTSNEERVTEERVTRTEFPSPLRGGLGRGNQKPEDSHPASPVKGEGNNFDEIINSLHKVWIIPERAEVYVHGHRVFVTDSHLKVMMEEDYLSEVTSNGQRVTEIEKRETGVAISASLRDRTHVPSPLRDHSFIPSPLRGGLGRGNQPTENPTIASRVNAQEKNNIVQDILRESILPLIEDEINNGEAFANLRQIYNSMILAAWYKRNLKDSLLGQSYVDRNLIEGMDASSQRKLGPSVFEEAMTSNDAGSRIKSGMTADFDSQTVDDIYQMYLRAFANGVSGIIREDYDPVTQSVVPRQYFTGGLLGVSPDTVGVSQAMLNTLPEAFQGRTFVNVEVHLEDSAMMDGGLLIGVALVVLIVAFLISRSSSGSKKSQSGSEQSGYKPGAWDAYYEADKMSRNLRIKRPRNPSDNAMLAVSKWMSPFTINGMIRNPPAGQADGFTLWDIFDGKILYSTQPGQLRLPVGLYALPTNYLPFDGIVDMVLQDKTLYVLRLDRRGQFLYSLYDGDLRVWKHNISSEELPRNVQEKFRESSDQAMMIVLALIVISGLLVGYHYWFRKDSGGQRPSINRRLIDKAFEIFYSRSGDEMFRDETFKKRLLQNPFILDNYRLFDLMADRNIRTPEETAELIRTFYPEGKDCEFIRTVDDNGESIGIGYLFHAHPVNDPRSVPAQRELMERKGRKVFGYESVTLFTMLTLEDGQKVVISDVRSSKIFDGGKITSAQGGHVGAAGVPDISLISEVMEETGVDVSDFEIVSLARKKRDFPEGFAYVATSVVVLDQEQSKVVLDQMTARGIEYFEAASVEALKALMPNRIFEITGKNWQDMEKRVSGTSIETKEVAYTILTPLFVLLEFVGTLENPGDVLAYGKNNFLLDKELMKKLADAIKGLSEDKAMMAGEQKPGGIDLDSRKLDLRERGDAIKFKTTGKNFDPVRLKNIQGLRPVIRSIVPIENIRLLLGLADEEDTDESKKALMDPVGRERS